MAKKLPMTHIEQLRFCQRLSLLCSCGIPILDILEMVAESFDKQSPIGQAIMSVRMKVAEGNSIAQAMIEIGFPRKTFVIVGIAEASGTMDITIQKYLGLLRLEGSDLKQFCKALAIMLEAELSLKHSLDLLTGQFRGNFSREIGLVLKRMNMGKSFSSALKVNAFGPILPAIVDAGTTLDSLIKVLNQYADCID